MIGSILAVCTGNICRSPLAEAYLRERLPKVRVTSAGVGALVGEPVAEHAVTVAEEAGLQLDEHRGRQVDGAAVRGSDLILVMERGQQAWIESRYPHARGRIFLLGHWSEGTEVPDPYGRDLDAFRLAFSRIRDYCDAWIARLP